MRVDDADMIADSGSVPLFFVLILIIGVGLLFLEDDAKLYQTCINGPHTIQNVILKNGTSNNACVPQEGNDAKL